MIMSKVAAALGIAFHSAPGWSEIKREMRHARAASFQHKKLNINAQTDSLDRMEEHAASPSMGKVRRATERLQVVAGVGEEDIRNSLEILARRLEG